MQSRRVILAFRRYNANRRSESENATETVGKRKKRRDFGIVVNFRPTYETFRTSDLIDAAFPSSRGSRSAYIFHVGAVVTTIFSTPFVERSFALVSEGCARGGVVSASLLFNQVESFDISCLS